MPELRAPENSLTGIEIKPNVRYPDQTEAAIVRSPRRFSIWHLAGKGQVFVPKMTKCQLLSAKYCLGNSVPDNSSIIQSTRVAV